MILVDYLIGCDEPLDLLSPKGVRLVFMMGVSAVYRSTGRATNLLNGIMPGG